MARVPVTPIEVLDNDVDLTTLTAFTADLIEYDNPGTNICQIYENTGVGSNSVVIKAKIGASTNDFDYEDRTIVLGAGETRFVSPNNPAVTGTPTLVDVVGTPAEVNYAILEIKKGF